MTLPSRLKIVEEFAEPPRELRRGPTRSVKRTMPEFEDDAARWVGDLTLSNVNPYASRPLRRAIADWQAKTGTTGRADPSPDEPDIGKELTWTVEEFFQLL
jgi:hypothetical protein